MLEQEISKDFKTKRRGKKDLMKGFQIAFLRNPQRKSGHEVQKADVVDR